MPLTWLPRNYFCQGRVTRRSFPASHDRGSPASGTSRSLAACSFSYCKRTIIVRLLSTARVRSPPHSVSWYILRVSTLTWPLKEGWIACFSWQNSAHRPEVPCGYRFHFLTSLATWCVPFVVPECTQLRCRQNFREPRNESVSFFTVPLSQPWVLSADGALRPVPEASGRTANVCGVKTTPAVARNRNVRHLTV